MINKDRNAFTFDEIVKSVFKYKNIEFEEFDFVHWRDFDGWGQPEQIYITDFSNRLVEGRYLLITPTAQISNIDKNLFTIPNFRASATFIKNNWIDVVYWFDYEDFSSDSKKRSEEYFLKEENKIKENIKEALKVLSMFFNMYKHKRYY